MKYIILMLALVACKGPAGNQGISGSSCESTQVAPIAAQLGGVAITCPGYPVTFVSDGAQGSQGLTGATGAQGQTGATGAAGTPGTIITPVQFCQGTPSYPSTFLEYGLCIGGVMYGVYSTNGGFLAELPDGYYSSDGVGSSCNFTITGCTVSN